jgi:hypothetical protein
MKWGGGNLAVLERKPASRPEREPRPQGPWLAFRLEDGRIGWRYDSDEDSWHGLPRADSDPPSGCKSASLRVSDSSILVITDRSGRMFLTIPPRTGKGPVTVVAKDCNVVLVEVLEPRAFVAVFRALLEHACPGEWDRLGPHAFELVLGAYLSRAVH